MTHREHLAVLCTRYAVLADCIPLRIGIHNELIAAGLSLQQARGVLKHHVANPDYLSACTEGAARVDLGGNVVGAVSAAQAEYARRKLADIKAREKACRNTEKRAEAKAVPVPLPTGTSDLAMLLRRAELRSRSGNRRVLGLKR